MSYVRGSGTIGDPFIIRDQSELFAIRERPAAHYRLGKSIELIGDWEPIPTFSGSLDGAGHQISGLQVLEWSAPAGLFGALTGAVSNLVIATSSVGVGSENSQYCGVLAGIAAAPALVHRVICLGKLITGGDRAGGFIGYLNPNGGCIRESAAFVEVSGAGTLRTGAMFGYIEARHTWQARSLVSSTSVAGKSLWGSGGSTLASSDLLDISDPSNPLLYPGWDFEWTWEISEGFPGFQLPEGMPVDETWYSDLAATIRVEELPARRQIIAIEALADGSFGICGSGMSTLEGVAEIPLAGKPTSRVYAVAIDQWGREFYPDMHVSTGDVIRPTHFRGWLYQVTQTGVLPSIEPEWWDAMPGVPQRVGTAMLQAARYYQPIAHGPIDLTWEDSPPSD